MVGNRIGRRGDIDPVSDEDWITEYEAVEYFYRVVGDGHGPCFDHRRFEGVQNDVLLGSIELRRESVEIEGGERGCEEPTAVSDHVGDTEHGSR
ncbi:hypothetical protein [Natronorubrum tibetense]|uniref:hypothetical protein n=1 Tax=Natronorubrum tibetense TaxID=63128 RepID=UPI001F4D354C|nr:hypothetical protein [Natronorubrum tibetense]